MPLSLNEKVKQNIKDGVFTCVVMREGEILKSSTKRGITPLIDINDFNPELLKSSSLYDKIIGRAAAMIAVRCKASFVYGLVMSQDAYALLVDSGIEAQFGEMVPMIQNRENTGMCPIEDSIKDIEDIDLGVKAIRAKVNLLMQESF